MQTTPSELGAQVPWHEGELLLGDVGLSRQRFRPNLFATNCRSIPAEYPTLPSRLRRQRLAQRATGGVYRNRP